MIDLLILFRVQIIIRIDKGDEFPQSEFKPSGLKIESTVMEKRMTCI